MKKVLLGACIFALAVAIIVVFRLVYKPAAKLEATGSSRPDLVFPGSITPLSNVLGATGEKSEGGAVTAPKYGGQALDFLGDPEILAGYPKEFVDGKRKQLAGVIGLVKENPGAIINWMEIGLIKKNFDNFLGVRDAWEYAIILNPKSSLAYYNLGQLYSAYLRDNQKAEVNFLQALELDESSDYIYLGLAEFYRDFYKEKYDQVDDVLIAGLKNLPYDANLIIQLALYYKNEGDKENAIKYFERFLKLPGLTGDQQKAVETELAVIRS